MLFTTLDIIGSCCQGGLTLANAMLQVELLDLLLARVFPEMSVPNVSSI